MRMMDVRGDGLLGPHDWWTRWAGEPVALGGILLAAMLYLVGTGRLWREAGRGRGLAGWQVWCFTAGLGVVALALFSPLDPLGETLFAAHMIQHLLLLAVAAPLLAAGAPTRAILWALPARPRRALGRWWNRRNRLRAAVGLAVGPVPAWVLSVAALILWHLPGPYRSALASEPVHALEHLSFLGTGFLFWWVVLRPDGHRRLNYGASVLYVFTASLPGGLLGALLTFAGRPLYPGQSASAPLWGLTPLEDQQLAGLVMWMPGGVIYLATAAVFFVAWLQVEGGRGSPPRRSAEPACESHG